MGNIQTLYVVSPEAVQELLSQVPNKFDRTDKITKRNHFDLTMGKTGYFQTSIPQRLKLSREHVGRSIQFNRASKYLPLIFAEVRAAARKWKPGTELDFVKTCSQLTLNIIAKVIFGRDLKAEASIPFEREDGVIEPLTFQEIYG